MAEDPILYLRGEPRTRPMAAPDRAAGAVMSALRDLAGLSRAEWVARVRQSPRMGAVNEAVVEAWETGAAVAGMDAFLVALAVVGRPGLVVLAGMLD